MFFPLLDGTHGLCVAMQSTFGYHNHMYHKPLYHYQRSTLIGDLYDYVRYYLPRLLMVSVNHPHDRKCIGIHDYQGCF